MQTYVGVIIGALAHLSLVRVISLCLILDASHARGWIDHATFIMWREVKVE